MSLAEGWKWIKHQWQAHPGRSNFAAFAIYAALVLAGGYWGYDQVIKLAGKLKLAGSHWGHQHQAYVVLSLLAVGAMLIFGVLPTSRFSPPDNSAKKQKDKPPQPAGADASTAQAADTGRA